MTSNPVNITALKSDVYKRSEMDTPDEQKAAIFAALGDLDQYEVLDEEVLIGLYVRPNVAARGTDVNGKAYRIITSENEVAETRYQAKVGCIIKAGPTAFKWMVNGQPYEGIVPEKGDWVLFKAADTTGEVFLRSIDSSEEYVNCKRFHWSSIKMRVKDPRTVR